MKNFISIFMLFGLLLTACKKENQTAQTRQQPDAQTIQNLTCLGFDTNNATICDDYLKLEEDMLVEVGAIDAAMNFDEHLFFKMDSEVDDRQYAVQNSTTMSVSMANALNINYFIHGSVKNIANGGADWEAAIIEAAKNWTDIAKCRIKFTKVTTHASANITFAAGNATGLSAPSLPIISWNTGDFAIACVPNNGSNNDIESETKNDAA
jgi:hypothetical protein